MWSVRRGWFVAVILVTALAVVLPVQAADDGIHKIPYPGVIMQDNPSVNAYAGANPEATAQPPRPPRVPKATVTASSICTMTMTINTLAYMQPNFSNVFATLSPGQSVEATARTVDGWYGFDPGIAQAGNEGLARLRWVPAGSPAGNTITRSPGCDSLVMVSYPSGPVGGTFGAPITFATHPELASYGFTWGPSDGQFGAIPSKDRRYTFYGTAHAAASCSGTPNVSGAFTFTGTLDHVTGSNGCVRLFGPGDGPAGWVFDKDYAGGGQVVRFTSGGKTGWLMPFHSEYHWKNLANPPSYLCDNVPCFYSSIGLAVSADDGKTFQVVGQIMQPSQPLSVFTGGGKNMAVGYGSLWVADADGKHLDNPPKDPHGAYFYLFFTDLLPGTSGVCASASCLGIARAPYPDVIAAALSGDPHKVATLFRKYDGASPDPWTQPATSNTPDLSGTAGKYAPLWTDEPAAEANVIYDRTFHVYLAVYVSKGGLKVRASSDLLHWSEAIGAPYQEAGRTPYYPTLLGETDDPTIGGPAPRVYFSSFPTGAFPDYKTAIFESVPLVLSPGH